MYKNFLVLLIFHTINGSQEKPQKNPDSEKQGKGKGKELDSIVEQMKETHRKKSDKDFMEAIKPLKQEEQKLEKMKEQEKQKEKELEKKNKEHEQAEKALVEKEMKEKEAENEKKQAIKQILEEK